MGDTAALAEELMRTLDMAPELARAAVRSLLAECGAASIAKLHLALARRMRSLPHTNIERVDEGLCLVYEKLAAAGVTLDGKAEHTIRAGSECVRAGFVNSLQSLKRAGANITAVHEYEAATFHLHAIAVLGRSRALSGDVAAYRAMSARFRTLVDHYERNASLHAICTSAPARSLNPPLATCAAQLGDFDLVLKLVPAGSIPLYATDLYTALRSRCRTAIWAPSGVVPDAGMATFVRRLYHELHIRFPFNPTAGMTDLTQELLTYPGWMESLDTWVRLYDSAALTGALNDTSESMLHIAASSLNHVACTYSMRLQHECGWSDQRTMRRRDGLTPLGTCIAMNAARWDAAAFCDTLAVLLEDVEDATSAVVDSGIAAKLADSSMWLQPKRPSHSPACANWSARVHTFMSIFSAVGLDFDVTSHLGAWLALVIRRERALHHRQPVREVHMDQELDLRLERAHDHHDLELRLQRAFDVGVHEHREFREAVNFTVPQLSYLRDSPMDVYKQRPAGSAGERLTSSPMVHFSRLFLRFTDSQAAARKLLASEHVRHAAAVAYGAVALDTLISAAASAHLYGPVLDIVADSISPTLRAWAWPRRRQALVRRLRVRGVVTVEVGLAVRPGVEEPPARAALRHRLGLSTVDAFGAPCLS